MCKICTVFISLFLFAGCLHCSNSSEETSNDLRFARYFDYNVGDFAKELSRWYRMDDINESNVMHVFLHYYRFSYMLDEILSSEAYGRNAKTPARVLNGFCNSFWHSKDSLVLDADFPLKNMVVDFKEIFNVKDNHDLQIVIKEIVSFLKSGSGESLTLMEQISKEGNRCLVYIRLSDISGNSLDEMSNQISTHSTLTSPNFSDVVVNMRDYYAGICLGDNGKWHCQFCVSWNHFSF